MTDAEIEVFEGQGRAVFSELAKEVRRLRMVLMAIVTKAELQVDCGWSREYVFGWNTARGYFAAGARYALEGDPNVWPFLAVLPTSPPADPQAAKPPTGEVWIGATFA